MIVKTMTETNMSDIKKSVVATLADNAFHFHLILCLYFLLR